MVRSLCPKTLDISSIKRNIRFITISSVFRIVSLVSFSQQLFTTSFVDGVLVPLLDRMLWKLLAYSSFQSFTNYFGYLDNMKVLGDSHKKDSGHRWKLKKNLKVPRYCFVGGAWNFFHPEEVPILKQHIKDDCFKYLLFPNLIFKYLLSYFLAQYP